jgi:hypothetical protein
MPAYAWQEPDMTFSASGGVTDTRAGAPPARRASAVFEDPRGLRRAAVAAVGALVFLGCVVVLALVGAVLYADPHAPAAGPGNAGRTSAPR